MTCVDCSCKKIKLDDHVCEELHEFNDSRILGGSKVLKDADLCDYPKIFPKILYTIWCMFKNIIAVICWILTRLDELERRINNMCSTIRCIVEYLKKESEARMAESLGKVDFSMRSGGTTINDPSKGNTYTKVDTKQDGSFTIRWNMTYAGTEIGKGAVTGKVYHTYSVNESDGSIQATIAGVKILSANYTGVGGNYQQADFSVMDSKGTVIWKKAYNPGQSWNETINKEVKVNMTKKLNPNGGTTGDIPLLRTYDNWIANDTTGHISAVYTNGNSPVIGFNCEAKC